VRLIAVADSDSYVKWGAAMLDRMPAGWQRDLVIIRTPALPSSSQLESAVSGTSWAGSPLRIVDLADLAALIAREQPDAVVLSLRGPVVRVVVRAIVATSRRRPLLVSGLPGIAIPETLHALYYRSQVDLLILHSKREIRAFTALAETLGIGQEFGLATLPFLPARREQAHYGDDIVFAAQAKVPRLVRERQAVLGWLAETARSHPHRRVVVKLRGLAGEAQTHLERHPYDVLMADVADVPQNLVVSTGPMADHLARAAAVVTISSTAAIEAVALGVPVLLINDFGVSGGLINLVFEDSGLLRSSEDLIAGRFQEPNEHWLDDNYFHAPSDETWIAAIEAGVARRSAGELVLRPQFRGSLGGNLRRIWDRKAALGKYDRSLSGYLAYAIGVPLRGGVRRAKSLRSRVRRARAARVGAVESPEYARLP
jgi:hypothetical protein